MNTDVNMCASSDDVAAQKAQDHGLQGTFSPTVVCALVYVSMSRAQY